MEDSFLAEPSPSSAARLLGAWFDYASQHRHTSVLREIEQYLATGRLPDGIERNAVPEVVTRFVVALYETQPATYVIVDALERIQPFRWLPVEELNLQGRVSNFQLDPFIDYQNEEQGINDPEASELFFIFSSTRSFIDNITDFQQFVLSQEAQLREILNWDEGGDQDADDLV